MDNTSKRNNWSYFTIKTLGESQNLDIYCETRPIVPILSVMNMYNSYLTIVINIFSTSGLVYLLYLAKKSDSSHLELFVLF